MRLVAGVIFVLFLSYDTPFSRYLQKCKILLKFEKCNKCTKYVLKYLFSKIKLCLNEQIYTLHHQLSGSV